MEGPLCRAMYGTKGWMKFHNFATSINFVPHFQEVVIVEVECTFRGLSVGEGCCSLAPKTVQLDRVVGRKSFGLQWSIFWEKKHLVTGAGCGASNPGVRWLRCKKCPPCSPTSGK